jgi:predicted DNA-binding protein
VNSAATAAAATHQDAMNSRLEPMLIRLPPMLADRLRRLARTTRVRQSDYLREAVSDLLSKYEHLDLGPGSNEPQGTM